MGKLSKAIAGVIAAAALLGTSSAQAVTLLSLIDPPGQSGIRYDLEFTANAATTTIWIGGYDLPAYEYLTDISVTLNGGQNLLGGTWRLTNAAAGSDAKTQSDGTSVPALWFGGYSSGNYDTFYQTFATTPDNTYLLTFDFTVDSFPQLSALSQFLSSSSSALLVTTSASAASVPEPSTWAMLLLGFAGLGLAGYRRTRKARLSSCPCAPGAAQPRACNSIC